MQEKEIESLVNKAKQRDADAFTELMQLYLKDMYRTAVAILMNDEDAADAIGDTILACWEKMDTIKKPQFFKTWMTRILINHCFRMKKRSKMTEELKEYEEPAAYDEYNLEFKEALASLGEKYRVVMTLFYGEGYRIEEIAKLLKLSKSTVQTRLQRGREKLARDYYGIRKGVSVL